MDINKTSVVCTGFDSDARDIKDDAVEFSIGLRITEPHLSPSEITDLQAEILRDVQSLLNEKYNK